jgi:hypothetical protein
MGDYETAEKQQFGALGAITRRRRRDIFREKCVLCFRRHCGCYGRGAPQRVVCEAAALASCAAPGPGWTMAWLYPWLATTPSRSRRRIVPPSLHIDATPAAESVGGVFFKMELRHKILQAPRCVLVPHGGCDGEGRRPSCRSPSPCRRNLAADSDHCKTRGFQSTHNNSSIATTPLLKPVRIYNENVLAIFFVRSAFPRSTPLKRWITYSSASWSWMLKYFSV